MKPFLVIVAVVLAVFALCAVDSKACDVAATVPAFSQGYCSQPAAAVFAPSYAPAFAPSYAVAAPAFAVSAYTPTVFAAPVAVFDVGHRRQANVVVNAGADVRVRNTIFGGKVIRVR